MKIAALVIGVLFLGVIGYTLYLFSLVTETVNRIHNPTEESEKNETQISSVDPMSVLVLGIDGRSDEGISGRSDTMMLITLNPNEESIKMMSIPRDTRAEIVGHGTMEKINHAYAYGGPKMAVDSVEKLLNVPINHYVSLDMEGFKRLVDALDGILVDNEYEFSSHNHIYHFPEGEQILNGEEALAYTRTRKEDPHGIAGRDARQREVVESMMKEGSQFSTILRIEEILDILGDSVQTDLTLGEIWDYQSKIRSSIGTMDEIQMEYDGAILDDGLWYAIVSDEEISQIRREFREHLGLDD
ncbi:LytR family transcriptional regulator [Oceanobacillus sp. 143]|uniref:LytR family transcriptional regulator n=2 Tax=Oceanobacillus zhaokaii TaxID=2052660 RepID=A0A345PM63_9BACI|nr:LytR family transcriptional regulator [Oceanobacillus zhaokaii]QGS69869.1 LytR family transcriptional regulator [Oceanobacillus sp. 143]